MASCCADSDRRDGVSVQLRRKERWIAGACPADSGAAPKVHLQSERMKPQLRAALSGKRGEKPSGFTRRVPGSAGEKASGFTRRVREAW